MMKIDQYKRWSLRLKMTLAAVAGVVLLAVVLVIFYGRQMARTADEALDKRAAAIATGLANECEYGLLVGNRQLVQQAVVKVLAQPDVVSAVVFSDAGKIVAAAGPVDLAAKSQAGPELVAAHNQAGVVEATPASSDNVDVFYAPVFLQPTSASADFEFDESSPTAPRQVGQKLGCIELVVSHAATDTAVAQARSAALLITVPLVAAISLICVWLVRRMIGPLRSLVQTTEELAAGNLQVRVPGLRTDEIGDLARSFNKMAEAIELSRAQILEHQATLERRVSERTADLEKEIAERSRAEQGLRERTSLAALSGEIGYEMIQKEPLAEMLQGCAESIVKHLGAAFARIWTLNEKDNVLELQASAGLYTHMDGPHGRVPVGKFKIGLIAQERKPHLTNSVVGDPRVGDQEWARREGMVAFAGYPLVVGDRLLGVVALFARQRLTDFVMAGLGSIADQIALGIEREQIAEALQQSEKSFRMMFASNPLPMWVYDVESWKFLEVNDAAVEHYGYSREEFLAMTISEIRPAEDVPKLKNYLAKQPAKMRDAGEWRHRCKNGEVIDVHILAHPVDLPGRSAALIIAQDITQRKRAERELEKANKRLQDISREAGMAEVATNVLHNVGNVLNSVNVSAALVSDKVRESKAANLVKVAALLRAHQSDLATFLTTDPKGRQLCEYMDGLAKYLTGEQSEMLKELESLATNVEHIKEIVAMQQSYARATGILETLSVADLVEDALRMNAGALARHQIEVVRDYQATLSMPVDKHKVLQILINLIRNAKYALDEGGSPDKRLTLRISRNGDSLVHVSVTDNGVGIRSEHRTRIFEHGFTTRRDGHGFGLHSGAIAAKEMGGNLTVHSDGPGRGATFTLSLPLLQEHRTP